MSVCVQYRSLTIHPRTHPNNLTTTWVAAACVGRDVLRYIRKFSRDTSNRTLPPHRKDNHPTLREVPHIPHTTTHQRKKRMATTIVLGMMSGSARGVGVGTWQSRSAGASQGSTDAGQGSMDAVVGGFSRSPEKRQSKTETDA